MFNQDEPQGETDHNFSNNMDNLVPESTIKIEANKGRDQFMKNSKEIFPQEQLQNPGSDNSFHLGNKIDDISRNEKFIQKEKEISQQLENIFKNNTNYSTSFFADKIYPINKILLLTTFTEFLFQRFDIVTLFLCIIIVLIELEIFTHKHLYKWLMLLVFSLLLDALVLLDVSPVSKKYFFNLIIFMYRQAILI